MAEICGIKDIYRVAAIIGGSEWERLIDIERRSLVEGREPTEAEEESTALIIKAIVTVARRLSGEVEAQGTL